MIESRTMFRQQRHTLFTSAGQYAWKSSLIAFRVGCPEHCRFVSDHRNISSTIRNFTSTIDDTKSRRRHHQSSPHYLLAIGGSSLFFTSVIKSKSRLRCNNRFSTHGSSSSSSNSYSNTSPTENKTPPPPTASVVASSLRRMIKPFLLKCHPDIRQQHQASKEDYDDDDDDGSGNSSISEEDASWAKTINLRAIQNLNSYLDSIQTLLHASSSSSSSSVRRRSPMNDSSSSSLVEIDFVIAVQSSALKSGGKKRHQSQRSRSAGMMEWHQSRRKVQLVLPQQQQHDNNNNNNMAFLVRHVHSELVRLLSVAGLDVPAYSFHLFQHDDDDSSRQGGGGQGANDATHPKGPFWHDDGLQQSYHFPFGGPKGNKSGRVASTTTSVSSSIFSRYKANRQQFVRDAAATMENYWNNEEYNNSRLFQHAMAESLIEDETRGLIANDAARRQDLIARILAKVQIQKQQQQLEEEQEEPSSSTSVIKDDEDEDDTAFVAATKNSHIVVVDDAGLEQLLAIRRLSLVLDDNFQVLQLEELGRLWENLTLVLLLPSSWDDDNHNNDNDIDNDDDNNAPPPTGRRRMRRTKRRRRQQQQQQLNHHEEWMDYAWTLHPDWSVTMHIPMDFEPDELVQELERNVQDFNHLLEEQTYHRYGGFPYMAAAV